ERKTVNTADNLVQGIDYKRDIDDLRESPALDIIRLLEERGANISYHDPYVPNLHREGIDLESQPLTEETLSAADAVVIVTDHTCLDYAWVAEHASIVVDTRNALKDVKQPRAPPLRRRPDAR